MASMPLRRATFPTLRLPIAHTRHLSTPTTPASSPFAPRHLLSIADVSAPELATLVKNAFNHKQAAKSGRPLFARDAGGAKPLDGRTVAVMFSKRSTRTRVSTESAIASMGGHPLFLGANDIQLGVNETLYDTSVVVSSMVSGIVARVNAHSSVADLAKHSSVPVVNALSDSFHPMQCLADYLTVYEALHERTKAPKGSGKEGLGLEGTKIAWVGDANNVLFDLAIGAMKLGVDVSVATPRGYGIPKEMRGFISDAAKGRKGQSVLVETESPEEAVKGADIIVTDTWVSMGQEAEKKKRLRDFEGFRVTADMAKRGGAKEDWKFMHCLPRHAEEVADEVFYSPRSLVFPEAENRLWTAISTFESFFINKGQIRDN